MANLCFLDTETLGLYGPPAIMQIGWGSEATPFIYCPWTEPAGKTRELLREVLQHVVVAHNLTFDWEKIQQLWAGLMDFDDGDRPIDDIQRFADSMFHNRSETCLKPVGGVCTLLLSQKRTGGAGMASKEIRVRKIPESVGEIVADVLNNYTDVPDIMFAGRNSQPWTVGESDAGAGWVDVVIRFAPSNALKDIAKLVLGRGTGNKIGAEVQPPPFPAEVGYAPYPWLLDEGNQTYQGEPLWNHEPLLREHVHFWSVDEVARDYALDDIHLLRDVYNHFGAPVEDFDSDIATQVASVRAAGFAIDMDQLQVACEASVEVVEGAEINVDSPKQVREYISEALDPLEAIVVAESANKEILKNIISAFVLENQEPCCKDGCPRCDGTGFVGPGPMPVVRRAQHVLDIRKHRKRIQVFDKLALACGAYPAFRVIGAKSGRMSGSGGLNYHGIDKSGDVRSIFTLAEGDWVVSGGDYDSQELAIAAAVMKDSDLAGDIAKGRSLHGVFAAEASGMPYEQIMAKKEVDNTPESQWYSKGKVCVYAILYGASAYNIAQTLQIEEEEAEEVIRGFFEKYPLMQATRKAVQKSLRCLHSSAGENLRVTKPEQTYIESIFGFRRSFEVELSLIETISQAMPEIRERLKGVPGRVFRKEKKGEQTLAGAVLSALYGAAFSIQGKVLRAGLNHIIQSAGRTITLRTQASAWRAQPVGVEPFKLKLMSVHDEIVVASSPETADEVAELVEAEVNELCKTVPLLSIGWGKNLGSWYGIKAGNNVTQFGYQS